MDLYENDVTSITTYHSNKLWNFFFFFLHFQKFLVLKVELIMELKFVFIYLIKRKR